MAWTDLESELGELFAELAPNVHDVSTDRLWLARVKHRAKDLAAWHAHNRAAERRARRAAARPPKPPRRTWKDWYHSPGGIAYRARKAATKRIYTYEGGLETSCRSILRTT